MKTRALFAALFVALAPVTVAVPALAQAPSEDPTTGIARARFKEGVAFYDKGEYERARASFLEAYALKKHPAVLLNLAWSCVKSGRALEAERDFKQVLTESKDITDKQRADATDGLAQSRTKLGRIEVVATTGTEVTIDGEKAGIAPLAEPVSVEVGAHTVKFKGADGSTDTESVTVMGGEQETAHFGKEAAPIVPPPPPPPVPPHPPQPTEGATLKPVPPPDAVKKPEEASPPEPIAEAEPRRGGNLLAPPRNLVPAVGLGVVAVAGFVTAGVLVAFKNKAQSNADSVADQIVAHGGGRDTCTTQGLTQAPNFDQACGAYATDNNNVNADATAGNVAVVVGLAATAGFVVYWLLADKGEREGPAATATGPVVTPLIGRSLGGLSLSTAF
jgi:tetratricopeptide (TPR) repeat protein